MSERRASREGSEGSALTSDSKSDHPAQESATSLEAAIAAEWGDLLDDASGALPVDEPPKAAARRAPTYTRHPSNANAAASASQTHLTSPKQLFAPGTGSRPVMPLLLQPIVEHENETGDESVADNDFGLPMVTSADLDRLARERDTKSSDSTTLVRKRSTTLNDLPPVPGVRRTLNRTSPGSSAGSSESNESAARRPPTGLHSTLPGTSLHRLKPAKTGSYSTLNTPRFSPPTLPTESERSSNLSPGLVPPRSPTISPLAGLRIQTPSTANEATSPRPAPETTRARAQEEESVSHVQLDAPTRAGAGTRAIRGAILAGSLSMAAVLLLALSVMRNDDGQNKEQTTAKVAAVAGEGVLQAGQVAPTMVAQEIEPDAAEKQRTEAEAKVAPTDEEGKPAPHGVSPAAAADTIGEGPKREVSDSQVDHENPSANTEKQAPVERTGNLNAAAPAGDRKLKLSSEGRRQAPPGTSQAAREAYESLPAEPDDREPIAGIGASGVHVDKLSFGSEYVDYRCVNPKTELSIAARDRAHVCVRFVHGNVRESVTIKWILGGKTIRRKVFSLSQNSHYGGGYMVLPVALEPGWHGDWTIRVEASDASVLGEIGFKVID
jgi:hypothetical protein